MEPDIADRGSHIEVLIGVPDLRGADFLDVLARATDRFGRRPILALCDEAEKRIWYLFEAGSSADEPGR